MAELQLPDKDPGSTIVYTIDYTKSLDIAEKITGTPTAVIVPSGGTAALVAAEVAIDAAGKKIFLGLSGGDAETTYDVTLTATSDRAVTPQVIQRSLRLRVREL